MIKSGNMEKLKSIKETLEVEAQTSLILKKYLFSKGIKDNHVLTLMYENLEQAIDDLDSLILSLERSS